MAAKTEIEHNSLSFRDLGTTTSRYQIEMEIKIIVPIHVYYDSNAKVTNSFAR